MRENILILSRTHNLTRTIQKTYFLQRTLGTTLDKNEDHTLSRLHFQLQWPLNVCPLKELLNTTNVVVHDGGTGSQIIAFITDMLTTPHELLVPSKHLSSWKSLFFKLFYQSPHNFSFTFLSEKTNNTALRNRCRCSLLRHRDARMNK